MITDVKWYKPNGKLIEIFDALLGHLQTVCRSGDEYDRGYWEATKEVTLLLDAYKQACASKVFSVAEAEEIYKKLTEYELDPDKEFLEKYCHSRCDSSCCSGPDTSYFEGLDNCPYRACYRGRNKEWATRKAWVQRIKK